MQDKQSKEIVDSQGNTYKSTAFLLQPAIH